MNSGVRHQIKLVWNSVTSTLRVPSKSKRGSQGRDDLGDKSVQVSVGRSLNIEISSADIIDGFVIEHGSNISVLKKRAG